MSPSLHITWDDAMEALGVRTEQLPTGTILVEPEPGTREFLCCYILNAIWWREATPTGHVLRTEGMQWLATMQGMGMEELEWIATAIDANLQGDEGTMQVVRRRLLGAAHYPTATRPQRPDRSGDRPWDLMFGSD